MESEGQIYIASNQDEAIRQGEILSGVIQSALDLNSLTLDKPHVKPITHPYSLVISQDCDLDWDHRARGSKAKEHKKIPSILLCHVETAAELRGRGPEQGINSEAWDRIKNNQNERFHYLELVEAETDLKSDGLPELGIDFKRYFTVPTAEMYYRIELGEISRRCRLISPYLEHLSTRFAYYQFRVALPEPHFSVPQVSE